MKRILLMALLALALPVAAFANGSVDFTNDGGTLTGTSDSLSLTGSTLIAINGLNGMGMVTGNLGTVSFSTGTLTSGSVTGTSGATFAAGGSFVITGNGMNGAPNGVIFSGSFSGPVTWTAIPSANHQFYYYTLSGSLTGTWFNGSTVNGAVVQLTIRTGSKGFGGTVNISSGDTNISTVPEPGTLGLMGTGLIGLAGALRRKLKS
jgi:hypothetical protein